MSVNPQRVLLLGGTREARELANLLMRRGKNVTTSLAGRTAVPLGVAGHIRVGGFGGVCGLARYLRTHDIDLLIDATHPFASQISKNAREASRLAAIPLRVFVRPSWQPEESDRWQQVDSLQEIAARLPAHSRVFLALGWQYVHPFVERRDCFFLLRMVGRSPELLDFRSQRIVLGYPSTDWRIEADLLTQYRISHIVCRNSGGQGAAARLQAARELQIPILMLERPAGLQGGSFPSLQALLSEI